MIKVAIGVDPGLANLGLAVIVRGKQSGTWRNVHLETLSTNSKFPLDARLKLIANYMSEIVIFLTGIKPEEVSFAVEEQAGALEGRRREGRTNADALLVQQAVGVIRTVAWRFGISVTEVSPQEAKRLLPGIKGNATKAQVQRAVRALVSNLPEKMSEHASDALAIAVVGARRSR